MAAKNIPGRKSRPSTAKIEKDSRADLEKEFKRFKSNMTRLFVEFEESIGVLYGKRRTRKSRETTKKNTRKAGKG